MWKQLSKVSLAFGLVASLGLSLSPAVASLAHAEDEPTSEAMDKIDIVGQLIELSNTSVPTVIVVRDNPTGEFTDYTVDITTSTKFGSFRWNTSSMEDWMTGDSIRIIGEKNENTGIIEATYAINQSINPLVHRGLNGWITAIDGTSNTIILQWNDTEHTVKVTDDTRLVISPNTNATLEDFKIGDRIRVRLTSEHGVDNEARFIVALRRGSELFLKARTRPFTAEVNSIVVNDDGSGTMQVTMGKNDHLLPGDVNNLFGVEGDVKTVTFDANTKFVRRYFGDSEATDIAPGDQLLIVGRVNDDSTISARLIKDSNIWKLGVVSHQGEVVSVDTATNTIVINSTSFRGEDKDVSATYNDDVKIVKDGATVTESAITVGDEIRVRGVARKSGDELVGVEAISEIWLSAE